MPWLRRKRAWVALILVLAAVAYFSIRPSNARTWSGDQTRLPSATFEGDLVHVKDIRNFHYRSTTDYDPAWYDKTFDLRELESLWFMVEPFDEGKGAAHTLVSFGFTGPAGPEYLAVSVEIRKEAGEEFSVVKGILRQYELMYVVADERDLIQLRSNYRKDDVYLYPIRAPKERIRAMLVGMLERANRLREEPEFYNTLTNTCTTNIVRHVEEVAPGRIPRFRREVILPGYSDRLAYDLDLLDTDLPFEKARERFQINERALRAQGDPDFSVKIREGA
ncbi:MAG TPA: DUF4105 domain-containing protein [Thermoanaerobaculia bacterium]|nr:DUF4105 domain-containing protein [Thermoanaerobaculia bacterium]